MKNAAKDSFPSFSWGVANCSDSIYKCLEDYGSEMIFINDRLCQSFINCRIDELDEWLDH